MLSLLLCWGITNPPVLIGRTFFYGGFQIRRDAWRETVLLDAWRKTVLLDAWRETALLDAWRETALLDAWRRLFVSPVRRFDGFAIRRKKGSTYYARGFAIPLSHRYAGRCLEAGDNISPEHKEVRTFFDGGLQIRRNA